MVLQELNLCFPHCISWTTRPPCQKQNVPNIRKIIKHFGQWKEVWKVTDKCLEVSLWSLSLKFPCQTCRNQTQMHYKYILIHLRLQWGSVQIGDIAEAALRVCLNKVKFNCGDVARVWNLVHVLSKHMFKMQPICTYTMEGKCMCATFVNPPPRKRGQERDWKCRNRVQKRKRQIQTEMILWSESFSSVCLSSTLNEWQMLQGGLLTKARPLQQITRTWFRFISGIQCLQQSLFD